MFELELTKEKLDISILNPTVTKPCSFGDDFEYHLRKAISGKRPRKTTKHTSSAQQNNTNFITYHMRNIYLKNL